MKTKPIIKNFLTRAAMTLAERMTRSFTVILLTLMTTATAWAAQPDCCLDACTGGMKLIHIAGWAYDPDAPAKSLTLELYIYADADCQQLVAYSQNFTADVSRPDVNKAKGITGNHGFEADIPMGTAGNYWVKLIAIDTNGDGNSQIGSTTKVTVIAGPSVVTLNENSGDVTLQNGDVVTGTGGGNTHLMIADGATVTLNNVTNTAISHTKYWPGIDCQGDATIILSGENAAKGDHQFPGVYVPEGKTLTIRGNGSLTATGIEAAGIGTSYGPSSTYSRCGNIIIAGGIVTAIHEGWYPGTGIGSGSYGSCGDITITGGIVTATGSYDSAGIGGAGSGSCGNITITGGTVTATGSGSAAGIGSGYVGSCGNITITGGTVTATGGTAIDIGGAAGIGSGYGGSCGNITISDGVTSVTATAGNEAPYSIGAGLSDDHKTSTCGTVTINGINMGNLALSTYTYVPSETIICTVTFDANGGIGTMANQTIYSNIPLLLTANSFKHSKYFFTGWNTAADGSGISYKNGQDCQAIATASSVTLFAQWSGDYFELQNAQTNDIELQDNLTISGSGSKDIHITIADGATVTLNDVDITNITNDTSHSWAGITCLGDATIILKGNNAVKGGVYCAGIFVPEGKTLTIRGDGSLTVTGNHYAAGIGGNDHTPCGNIVIAGGNITATGAHSAAGIGSGREALCGNITITGGSIMATGGGWATGIGCGDGWSKEPSSCGDITITSGVTRVIATKVDKSKSVKIIGSSGANCPCGTVTIDPSLIDVISNDKMTRTLYHGMVLFDDDNNATAIEANDDGATHDAQLRGRTLYKDGDWNTICLPFDVTVGSGQLEGVTAMMMDASTSGFNASSGVLTLNFTGVAGGSTIAAGTPFIVKWTGSNVTDPVFSGVTVFNTEAGSVLSQDGNVRFQGTYSPVQIYSAAHDNLFLGGENTLYWPDTEGYTLGACRAYFHVDLNGGSAAVRQFVLNFGDSETTGIISIENGKWKIENEADAWYDLSGRRLNGKPTQKGLYINNGRKVVIK